MKKIIFSFAIFMVFAACNQAENNNKPEVVSEQKMEKHSDTISQEPFNSKEINDFWGKDLSRNGDFYKITFPRTDITLKIDGYNIEPGLAYTSWIAYLPVGDSTRIMGDMVLLDSETSKVISYFKQNGINITAIHNHLLREEPRLVYMHFGATGNSLQLSKVMQGAYQLTATPLKKNQEEQTREVTFDWSGVKKILGDNGTESGNLLKYGFPRNGDIKINETTLPKAYGIATAIGFQAIDANKVAITGDFVMLANEVNDVIAALAKNNIEVTALHNHMLFEEPRLFYMHFWAVGNAQDLANGFKAALDKTQSVY